MNDAVCEPMHLTNKSPAYTIDTNIVLLAGGTGGHVFPAVAIAQVLIQKYNLSVTLITDPRGQKILSAYDYPGLQVKVLPLSPIKYSFLQVWDNLTNISKNTWIAYQWLKELAPAVVVGFGGYPTFPGLVASLLQDRDIILHEQNTVIGKVNRWFLPWAKRFMYSFLPTYGLPHGSADKLHYTGMPVREAITLHQPQVLPTDTPQLPLRLAVIGGSQGAAVFSRVIPAAIAKLSDIQRQQIKLWQQCPESDVFTVRQQYQQLGVEAEVKSFFPDVQTVMAQADLLVMRAGASSVAESIIMNKPALLVPHPKVADNHQTFNAQVVGEGGWCVAQEQFTPEYFNQFLVNTLACPQHLLIKKQKLFKLLPASPAAQTACEVIMDWIKHQDE